LYRRIRSARIQSDCDIGCQGHSLFLNWSEESHLIIGHFFRGLREYRVSKRHLQFDRSIGNALKP
jgi:hypothetical protein